MGSTAARWPTAHFILTPPGDFASPGPPAEYFYKGQNNQKKCTI
jgi:hypothetical protein